MSKGLKMELSNDTIERMMNLPLSRNPITIDYNLQVRTVIMKDKSKQNIFFPATLSDNKLKYCGFIFIKSKTTLKSGDIIHLQSVSISPIRKGTEKVFIVRKYEIIRRNTELVNNLTIATTDTIKNDTDSKTNVIEEESQIENLNMTDINTLIQENAVASPSQSSESNHIEDNETTVKKNNSMKITKKDFVLLKALNTFSRDIKIYVKVAKKCEIKSFFNKVTKKKSKLLSFDIIDIEGFEMQATIFDQICDKFYPIIQENEIYYITGGYVRMNDKKYTNIKSDYKIIFDQSTTITPIDKSTDDFFPDTKPRIQTNNIVKIKDLPNYEHNSIIDCLVFVIESFPKSIKQSKIGEISFRRIIVGDDTNFKIEFTLWKKFSDIEIEKGMYLLLKYIRVNDYNGLRLSTVDDSNIILNPSSSDVKQLDPLREFIQSKTDDKWLTFKDSELLNVDMSMAEDSNNSNLGESIKTYYLNDILLTISSVIKESPLAMIKGTVLEVNHSTKNFYGGCPNKGCKKKLIQSTTSENFNKWFCPLCKKNYDNPYYYYTVSLHIKDASAEHYVDFFGDTVTKMFGIRAEDYKELITNNDIEKLSAITERLEYHSFYFIGKANYQIYNNKVKKKFFAYRYELINKQNETRRLMNNIKSKLAIK